MSQEILLGDEAVARGAIDAGISAAYAYPGTPSTEIFQTVQAHAKRAGLAIRGLWSTNEKVALEEGAGVSYAGKRALVAMKHVGLNVAADPFMNLAVSGAHGGLVIAVADDPSMHSSQNEQDSRYFADFAQIPCLEPADQQQCYDFTREAFELSERQQVPVLLRLVTRLAHSRASVTLAPARAQNEARYVADSSRFTLIPSNARRAYAALLDKQAAFNAYSEAHAANTLVLRGDARPGILASGVAWNYLQEALGSALDDYNVLRIGTYPLPVAKIRRLLDASSEMLDRGGGLPVHRALRERARPHARAADQGQAHRTPAAQRRAGAGRAQDELRRRGQRPSLQIPGLESVLVGRPPRLCDACPHTDAYAAIKAAIAGEGDGIRVMGDIGCYALGYLKPHQAIHSCLCMGASIGMAIGAAHAGMRPSLCVIGDGTFTAFRHGAAARRRAREHRHHGLHPRQQHRRDDRRPADDGDRRAGRRPGRRGSACRASTSSSSPRWRSCRTTTFASSARRSSIAGLSVIIARRACVTYAKTIKAFKRERRAVPGVRSTKVVQ